MCLCVCVGVSVCESLCRRLIFKAILLKRGEGEADKRWAEMKGYQEVADVCQRERQIKREREREGEGERERARERANRAEIMEVTLENDPRCIKVHKGS